MTAVFLKLLNMSLAASWLVLVVLVLRMLFRKAPKAISCILWGLVAMRLVFPFSIESIFSLIPSAETVPQEIVYVREPAIHSGVAYLNSYVNPIISEKLAPTAEASVSPMQTIVSVASVTWLVGVIVMVCYGVISYVRLYRRTRERVKLSHCLAENTELKGQTVQYSKSQQPVSTGMQCLQPKENIWLCDHISTPFILGFFRPHIFLPSAMKEDDMEYVIAHERAHLKRRDHWWKPIGFALLTIYWFNPLMWIAYILLCRDIELACDERVIKDLGKESKKPYLEALISCSASRKIISACPLAFGEVGVERRIKNVLHYKKPAFWIMVVAVIACIAVAVCFLTNPAEDSEDIRNSNIFIEEGNAEVTVPWYNSTASLQVDEIEYVYKDSPEPLMPRISLSMADNRFNFSYALFSSTLDPGGTFEVTDTELILTTEDVFGVGSGTKKKYVFRKDGDNYVFVADKSTRMPNYNYGGDEKRTQPVPDGAVFEPIVIHLAPASEDGYSAVMDGMVADIDKDGVDEICLLSFGRTSGLFTFVLSAREYGSEELEYFNVYNSEYYYLDFFVDYTGNFYLKGTTQGENPETYLFKLSIEEGNIVLTKDGTNERLEFWGEQGVASECANGR